VGNRDQDRLFDKWNEVKKRIQAQKRHVGFKEREIFWVRVGYNVGSEEYGKGNEFQRPVIVVRKLTPNLFFGVPLSTVLKDGDYFHTFTYQTKKGEITACAMILQLRAFDKKRLMGRMGMVPKQDYIEIIEKIRRIFSPPSE